MNALLLALVYFLQRSAGLALSDRFDEWWLNWLQRRARAFGPDTASSLFILAMAALPALLLLLLLLLLARLPYGLGDYFVGFCVLTTVLGSRRTREELARLDQQGSPRAPASLPRLVMRSLQEYYVIAFWFVFGGPVGALLVRCLQVADQPSIVKGDSRWQAVRVSGQLLEWLPLRLAACLVGFPDRWPDLLKTGQAGTLVLFGDRLSVARALVPGTQKNPVASVRRRLGLAFLVLIAALLGFDLVMS